MSELTTQPFEIGCDKVSAAFFELFKAHPVLMKAKPKAIEVCEMQAALLLLCTSRGQWEMWDAASEDVRSTATALLTDFFIKVSQPRKGEFLANCWRVTSPTPVAQALDVLGQEIVRSHPWLQGM